MPTAATAAAIASRAEYADKGDCVGIGVGAVAGCEGAGFSVGTAVTAGVAGVVAEGATSVNLPVNETVPSFFSTLTVYSSGFRLVVSR